MTVTIHSPFKAKPRISETVFVSVLADRNSFESDALWLPTVPSERREEARAIYSMIVAEGHDPATWLAILGKESSFGTNHASVLWRNSTHSWTNARTVRHPALKQRTEIIHDASRGSDYVRYRNAYDSVQDGLYRVDEPGYAYRNAKATTIVEHIRVWAPAKDKNMPEQYAQQMVDWINAWMAAEPVKEEPPVSQTDQPGYDWKYSPCFGYPIDTAGRNGITIDRIIYHTSEGSFDSGVNWLTRWPTATDEGSSTHYFISADGKRRAQLVRERDAAWTAGNREYNLRGVNIELEGYAARGGFTEGAYRELAALSAGIMQRHPGIKAVSREYLIGHYQVPPPNDHTDPGPHFRWDTLLRYINEARDVGAQPPKPHPTARFFSATGQFISQGFKDFWEQFGDDRVSIAVFGYPLSGESPFMTPDGKQGSQQYFERAKFEWHPGVGVLLARLGAEALEAA